MATVTGKSSNKIDQILNEALVGADLDPAGSLTFTKKSGATVNAGSLGRSVVSAVINASKHLIFTKMDGTTEDAGSIIPNMLAAWPVGSVYIGMTPTSPATLFGGGTWVRLAKGRTLVGVDEADASFDAIRETGGSKTAPLPAHTHPMPHTHEHPHTHALPTSNNDALGGTSSRVNSQNTGAVSEATTSGPSATNTGNPTDAAVSTLQPYITTYIWERTA